MGSTEPRDWTYAPARDHGLAGVRRFRSVSREPGLLSSAAHAASCACLCAYFGVWHRLRIEGRERFPKRPPFVVVANHASHLDALVLACALPRRLRGSTYPISAGDVFFESAASSILAGALVNALPLWRRKVTRHALEDLRERLVGGGCSYILFPEGARSRDGTPMRFKPGVGSLVAGTGVPVVPCHIDGAFEAFPPGTRLPRPRALRVRVGEPLTFEGTPHEREGWAMVADRLQEAVELIAAGRPRDATGPG